MLDKIRNAVAGRGPQPGGRDFNGANRTIHRPGIDDPGLLSDPPEPVRLDFLAALLVAFHGWPVDVTVNPQPASCEKDGGFSSGRH